MKKISSAINIFCYKHPKFGISRLMMYIVGGTALVFVIDMMDTTGTFLPMLMFLPDQVFKGEIWRIVTWVFIPANSNILWLAISLYFYYWIGSTLEQSWGAGKLTIYYLSGILLNVVFSLVAYRIGGYYAYVVLSPTYLNLSFFFAFASLYPDTRVMLMFFIPVKIKWLAWINAALYAYQIFQYLASGRYLYAFVPVIATLNFILICGIPKPRILSEKQRKAVASFRRGAGGQETRDSFEYRHKCTICGRTDKSDPELEFRYCSRCEGFKCYCEEHIENHTHR